MGSGSRPGVGQPEPEVFHDPTDHHRFLDEARHAEPALTMGADQGSTSKTFWMRSCLAEGELAEKVTHYNILGSTPGPKKCISLQTIEIDSHTGLRFMCHLSGASALM